MFGFVTKRSIDDALAIIRRQEEQIAALRNDLATARDCYHRAAHECNRLRSDLTAARNAVTIERNRRIVSEAKAERHLAALCAKSTKEV